MHLRLCSPVFRQYSDHVLVLFARNRSIVQLSRDGLNKNFVAKFICCKTPDLVFNGKVQLGSNGEFEQFANNKYRIVFIKGRCTPTLSRESKSRPNVMVARTVGQVQVRPSHASRHPANIYAHLCGEVMQKVMCSKKSKMCV